MDGESILACIIMCMSTFGCGIAFFCIGLWAKRRKDPMHFYSGTTVDPKTISDIPAYNAANAKLWQWYAVPYLLSGICAILAFFDQRFMNVSLALMLLGFFPGILFLVTGYHKILKTYKIG